MTTPQPNRPPKFNFDTVFGAKGTNQAVPENRSRSAYSAEEVDTIRKEMLAQGKAAASAEASAVHAMALTSISQSMVAMISQFDAYLAELRTESAALALSVGKKLAESALSVLPHNETEALIAECMHKLHLEPRLVVRVSAELAEHIKSRVEPLSEGSGFAGRVIVLVEPALTGPACRVEWADGGIERDLVNTFAEIEDHMSRWRASSTGEEN